MNFEKASEGNPKKRSDLTLAGAVALAISSGADAKAEEHVTHLETGPHTITEVEQAHDLDQVEQAQYAEVTRLISEHAGDTKELMLSLMSGGEEKGIFYRVSPDVVAAVNLDLLTRGDHISLELAPFILITLDTYQTSEHADEILLKAAEISGEWRFLGMSIDDFFEQNPPWLKDLLEKVAERVDVDTFFDDVLKVRSDGFLGQSKTVQEWLRPIIEKHYPSDPIALVESLNGAEEFIDRYRLISDQIPRFSSIEQVMELVDTVLVSGEDEVKREVIKYLVENVDWWSGHSNAGDYLQKITGYIAEHEPYQAFQSEFIEVVSGQPWEHEYYETALEKYPWAYFEKFELLSNIIPPEEVLTEYAEKVPTAAIDNFRKYQESPVAIEAASVALKHADPVRGIEFIEWAENNLTEEETERLRSSLTPNATLEVAVLSSNLSPNYRTLREDSALVNASEIDRQLILALIDTELVSESFWSRVNEQMKEQAMRLDIDSSAQIQLLREHSEHFGNIDPVALENAVVMVARNLHSQGLPFTEENVRIEVERIAEMRERIGNQDLFSGDVALASHGEIFEETRGINQPGEVRFGTAALVDSLRARVDSHRLGNNFSHFGKMENGAITPEMIAAARAETIATITNNLNALTIVFDGHGSRDAFYFSDGQINEGGGDGEIVETDTSVKISAEDFAAALIERYQKQIESGILTEGESNINLVFSACYMNDLINALSEKLRESGTPLPWLMISAAERGQTSYSDFHDTFGSTTNRWIAESGDIRELIEREGELDSNPSIFVPDPSNPSRPMQVSGVVTANTNPVV